MMNVGNDHPVFNTSWADMYPAYVTKVEKKKRTKEELDQIITWLTGYSQKELDKSLDESMTLGEFFDSAPKPNPAREKITGWICGIKVQDLEKGRMKEVRYLDKLVDELAKGKAMDKIMRTEG